jgi:hypothetical protein
MPVTRRRRVSTSLLVALMPALALVCGLPFVNRLEPRVFGLPFLLAWILGWVMVTPLFLYAAYIVSAEARAPARTEACPATKKPDDGAAR